VITEDSSEEVSGVVSRSRALNSDGACNSNGGDSNRRDGDRVDRAQVHDVVRSRAEARPVRQGNQSLGLLRRACKKS
jgi:hypothetical protein